jgi:4-amino-4-deoxy-L-arabinose transferase-like glycosyltransferase
MSSTEGIVSESPDQKTPWLRFVVALVVVAGGQWIINRREPFLIIFTFSEKLEREFLLAIPNLNQVILGVILLVVGGVLFAQATRTLRMGAGQETSEGKSGTAVAGSIPAVMAALPTASLLLSLWVAWRIGSDHYSDWLPWLWVLSIAFMALFWLGLDRRRGIRPHIRLAWTEVAFLAALLAIGLLIASYHLADIPDSLMGDEGSFWEISSAIARGEYHPNLFGFGTYSYPLISIVYQSIFPHFFGFSLWSWRIGSVVAGVLAVVPLYLLLREIFSTRVGALAAAVMIVSPYFLAFARLGYNNSQALFPVVLSLLFLYVGARQRSGFLLYLAGAVAGLGFYTYTAGRLAVVVAILYLAYLFLKRDINWRSGLTFGAVFMVGLVLVLAPQYVFGLIFSPQDMSHKMLESVFFNAFYGRALFGDAGLAKYGPIITWGGHELFFSPVLYARLIVRGFFRTLIAFNHEGLVSEHFITSSLAGPFASVLFVLGSFFALKRIRQSGAGLILIWLFAALITLSALTTFPPRHQHLVSAIPAMAALIALGIEAVGQFIAKGSRMRWLSGASVFILLGVTTIFGLHEYFVRMPDEYRPNIENILFWTAQDATIPGNLIYIDDRSEQQKFVPWGIKYFNTPLQYATISRAQFLQAPGQFQGTPTVFVFSPEASDVLVQALQQQYGGQGILHRYSDPGGRPIAVAYATGGLLPHRYQPQVPRVDPQAVQLALAVVVLFVACLVLLKAAGWGINGLAQASPRLGPLAAPLHVSGFTFPRRLMPTPAGEEVASLAGVGEAAVAGETTPAQVEPRARISVNVGLVSLVSVAALLVALVGQYQLMYPRNLNLGLVLFGIGILLFLPLATLLVPNEWSLASARRQVTGVEGNGVLISSFRARVLLIAESFVLSLLAVMMIASRKGSDSYWDIFLLWIASMAFYLIPFFPHRLRFRASTWREHWKPLLLVGLIVLVAMSARLYELGNIPQVMENDEGIVGTKAVAVLNSELKSMFQTYGGYGTLDFFGMALSVDLLGKSKLAVRLPSALAGILTVPMLALLAYRLFGTKVALVSAALLAISHFHIHFSRVSPTAASLDPLLSTLSLYLVYRGLRTRQRSYWALAGLVMGVALYFYVGARIIPVIAAVFIVLLIVVDRRLLRGNFGGMLALAGAYGIAAAPMGLWAVQHPDVFNVRLNQVGIVQTGWLAHEVATRGLPVWRILAEQFANSMLIFNFHPARWFYDATVPMLGPLTGALFVLGLAYSITRLGDSRFLLLNTWFWVALVTGQFLMIDPAPNAYRTMILLPAVLIMAAVALVKLVDAAVAWANHRERLAPIVLVVILGLAAAWNVRYYFAVWAPSYRYSDPNSRLASLIGEYLGELHGNYRAYIVGAPRFRGQGWSALDYLRDGTPLTDVEGSLQDTVRSVNPGQNAVFIFVPERMDELPVVEQLYPNGHRVNKYLGDSLYFVAYEVGARQL